MSRAGLSDEALAQLQHDTFGYFLKETNPDNGLVPDSTRQGAPLRSPPSDSVYQPTRSASSAVISSAPKPSSEC